MPTLFDPSWATNGCLITGCKLFLDERMAHGDLHHYGDCYVFNAVLIPALGETDWRQYTPADMQEQRGLIIPYRAPRFERRGVIVVPQAFAILNQVAIDYLNRSPS